MNDQPSSATPTEQPSSAQTLTKAQLHKLLRQMGKASKHRKPTPGAFGKSHFWSTPASVPAPFPDEAQDKA